MSTDPQRTEVAAPGPRRRRTSLLIAISALTIVGLVGGLALAFAIGNRSGPSTAEVLRESEPTVQARLEHDRTVFEVAFSPDGRVLATGAADSAVRLWDTGSAELLAELAGHLPGAGRASRELVFSPDGAVLATVGADSSARLWEAGSGAERVVLEGHEDELLGAAFSPDGSMLATRGTDGTARLWDSSSGEQLAVLGHDDWVFSVAFSPDGALVATASGDGTMRLWDSASGSQLALLDHGARVQTVAFSPDSGVLVSGDYAGTVRLWDVNRDGSAVQTNAFPAHDSESGSWVLEVAFSPAGGVFATRGRNDSVVRLWDASSGDPIARLTGHEEEVRAMAFSPDGTVLATGSDDGTSRLWDASSGDEFAVLDGHDDAVYAVAFSPDGALLATGGAGGEHSTLVWRWGSQ